MNSLEALLALRFLSSKKRQGFLSITASVAIAGMAFGVMALLVSLSVISGFQREYKKAILKFNSHLILMSADEIEHHEEVAEKIFRLESPPAAVTGISPFIYREGMAVAGARMKGIVLKGIDFDRFLNLSQIQMERFREAENLDRLPPLFLGVALARELGFQKDSENRIIRVLFPQGNRSEAEGLKSLRRFFVAGTFTSGLHEYDASFAFLPLADAEKFFQTRGRVSGLEVWLDDPDRAEAWAALMRKDFEFPNVILTWRDLNENIFRALELEKVVFFLLMMVLVAVASLNILGTLMMLLLEKRGEIAVLRALGLSWKRTRKVFLFDGLLIGCAGIALGVVLGLGVLFFLDRWQPIRLAEEVYFLSRVPVALSKETLVGVVLAAFGVVFFGCELALRHLSRKSNLRVLLEN